MLTLRRWRAGLRGVTDILLAEPRLVARICLTFLMVFAVGGVVPMLAFFDWVLIWLQLAIAHEDTYHLVLGALCAMGLSTSTAGYTVWMTLFVLGGGLTLLMEYGMIKLCFIAIGQPEYGVPESQTASPVVADR